MKSNHSPDQTVAAIAADRVRRQLLGRIVSALEVTFQIPPGDHLVCVLGDGTERSNREALFSWTTGEVARLGVEAPERYVPVLAERLHQRLTAWDLDRCSL